jgi:hypothetical protein
MLVLLSGSDTAFRELCGTSSSILCDEYRRNPKTVRDNIPFFLLIGGRHCQIYVSVTIAATCLVKASRRKAIKFLLCIRFDPWILCVGKNIQVTQIRCKVIILNICIKKEIVVKEGESYTGILSQLRVSYFAKIVIVFLRSHVVDPVTTAINENMDYGVYNLISVFVLF